MLKKFLLPAIAGFATMLSAGAADLIFHFDFKDAANQEFLTDLTGRVTLRSKTKNFAIQEDALRLADCAQFSIRSKDLPALTDKFTFNIWVNKARAGEYGPLFFKGMHPEVQFLIGITHLFPEFVYKSDKTQGFWQGIELSGTPGSHKVEYRDPSVIVEGVKPAVTPGVWSMLTTVFDRGSLSIYLDGKLVLSKKSASPESLTANEFPLYLGAERIPNSSLNYRTANMFVNDWRLYDGVLDAAEIGKLYESERRKYTKVLLDSPSDIYPECSAYVERVIDGYDPEFKRKLPLTAKYEKNLPAESPTGKGHTTSKVEAVNGVMEMFINKKQYFPLLFASSPEDQSIHAPRNPANFGIRDFAAAGIPLFGTGVHTWRDMILVWKGRKDYDFSSFDKAIREALAANPTGHLQVSFFPEGIAWFQREHARELERCYPGLTSKGELSILYQGPFGSDVWLEVSSEMLGDLVRYIEAQDYADRIYDYKLFCGGGGEWYWPGCFMGFTAGYSDATRDTFRNWLRAKYGSDEALQKAWHDPAVTLETAVVPTPEFRYASEHFNFRDPFKAHSTLDFRDYMGDRTYENIAQNTKAIKEGCEGKKTVTIYYGYQAYFSNNQNRTQLTSGTQMLAKVFRLSTVDNIATPIDYQKRMPGEPGGNFNPFNGSALLHNKLIWQENDLRTHLYPKDEYGRTNNLEETLTVIRRGFGQALTAGMGLWYYALPANYVYHLEPIMQEMKKIGEVSRQTLKEDRSSIAEVALIFDEKSTLFTGFQNSAFIDNHTWQLYLNALRMGAPIDAYLLSDIGDPKMPDYKLYIFMNTYYTDAKLREEISTKVRKNHAMAVWCYAPGFLTEEGFNDKTMQELTGFTLRSQMKENPLQLEIVNTTHPLTRHASKMESYSVGPVIWSEDPDAEVLGKVGDKAALAVKRFEDWTSVYTLMPLTKELLAGICEFAGVHRFNKDYDILTANKSYVMLHTSTAGDKTIELSAPSTVTEVFSRQVLGKNIKSFIDKNVPAQSTKIYLIHSK